MYNLYLFEAVYVSHVLSLEKKGLECCLLSIKLPMYLLVLYGAGRMDLDGGNPFLGEFEGVGPEILVFFWS